jgi:hypothetical protein
MPVLLQPYIWSLDREAMFNVCFGVYCDVFGISPVARIGEPLVPRWLQPALAPHMRRCRGPFSSAYDAVMRRDRRALERFLADRQAVRVALVGREYLISEPLLTADLKGWFVKAGARVITPGDVWVEDLPTRPASPGVYYDTHWLFDALVEFLIPHVDGFVFAGSFACHPDAFILELLLDRVRSKGIPAWLLRYDEQSGSAGFQTRYETIMRFLEQRRDRRLAGEGKAGASPIGLDESRPSRSTLLPSLEDASRVPLITWPYMSDQIELIMRSIATQAGLTPYVVPPKPLSEATLALGADTFTESCCPYAFSLGSLKETLRAHLEAHPNGPPRRIVALTATGRGPCSFGLYLLGYARDVRADLAQILQRGRHTLEFVSIGLSDAMGFIRELAGLGDGKRLAPIVSYMRMASDGTLRRLPAWPRLLAARRLWATVGGLLAPARAGLAALEAIRARALIVRAHETVRGATTAAYRTAVARLAEASTVEAIREARDRALASLAAVPQDREVRPRVGVVGEIYVVAASFANRGVIDNLLARHKIEVVEGTTLSSLIALSEREMRRRAWINAWPLRPILQALWRRNLLLFHHHSAGGEARPFMNLGVGGEGNLSVAHSRRLLEAGVDGIVHLMPFKCMPEGIAKAAMAEMCRLYGVPYLPLSFNRELEIERIKTEIATFAALLHARVGQQASDGPRAYARARAREIARRIALGRAVNVLHRRFRRHRYAVA